MPKLRKKSVKALFFHRGMRPFKTQRRIYAPLHTRFYLHVAYANVHFERAVRLYLEKGYRYVNPVEYQDIVVTMEYRTSKRAIRVLHSWEDFTKQIDAFKSNETILKKNIKMSLFKIYF